MAKTKITRNEDLLKYTPGGKLSFAPTQKGQIDYSILSQYVEYCDTQNPAVGITIKQLYDNRFELMYLTVEKMLNLQNKHKEAQTVAYKFLEMLEKELKRVYKEKTGLTLKFKIIDEREGNEPLGYYAGGIGPRDQSFYFRLFRQYEINAD